MLRLFGALALSLTASLALATTQINNNGDLLEVKGNTHGYGSLRKDGKIDFSLVFPALRRDQLMSFDISNVISPEMDVIKVITQKLYVPSNISLPKQTENYILPITINKDIYRMYLKETGSYRMTAIHGQFPLKRVISDINNGKSYFEVINYFRFFGGGQINVDLQGNLTGQNIPINQMTFNSTVTVPGPAVPEGLYAVGMAMVDQNGLLFPTDLKQLTAGKVESLKTLSNSGDNYVLTLLTEDRDFPAFTIGLASWLAVLEWRRRRELHFKPAGI